MRVPAGLCDRSITAALALLAAAGAVALVAHHPLAPGALAIAAAIVFAATLRWPHAWLFFVPALLPVADLSPWTGWVAFDEFDLLLLTVLAAGHARRAWRGEAASRSTWLAMAAGLALFCLPGLWRGVQDAGGPAFGWFDAYVDPVNTLRVGKSAVFALLLLPLVEDAMRSEPDRAGRHLALGVLAGLSLACAVAVFERAAYPGLLDAAEPYRTTAAFWEMHVGGAAIDGYLALATPFVGWALWSARGRRLWLAAAALAVVVGYVCLTTFSRGVYAAVLLPLLLLGVWLWAGRRLSRRVWRVVATALLILLIAAETLAVLAPDSYMSRRMNRSQRDYTSRVAHWQAGLALRETAADRWLGIGLGRLPAHYARGAPRGEFSGGVRWVPAQGRQAVRIDGPRSDERLGGLYGLTQQVPPRSRYRLQLVARTPTGIDLYARVCESHLLYDAACQEVFLRATPEPDEWQPLDVELPGPTLGAASRWLPRSTVLTLSVANPGGWAEFDDLRLLDPTGRNVLRHGGFEHDLAHWWPAAHFYFLPWHIDNLYLELLIERGWLGLAAGAGLLAVTLMRLLAQGPARAPLAPFIAASLLGAAIVGAISSLLDMPRTAFLLSLLIAIAWHLRPAPEGGRMP